MTFFDISRFHREEICDDEIDLMHALDVLQSSSVGRTQSGADSPPFVRHADVTGPRQPKTERGPHFVMPSNLTKMDPDLALSPSPKPYNEKYYNRKMRCWGCGKLTNYICHWIGYPLCSDCSDIMSKHLKDLKEKKYTICSVYDGVK